MENQPRRPHKIEIDGDKIFVGGVIAVENSDDNTLVLKLDGRFLTINGTDLNIEKLDLAEAKLNASGKVEMLKYGSADTAKKLLKRMFK